MVCGLMFGVNLYTLLRSGASVWNWILLAMALGLGLAFVSAARGEQKKRRAARYYDRYLELVRSQGSAAIRDLAASVDLAEEQVRRHLKAMQKSPAYRQLHIDLSSGRVADVNAQTKDKAQERDGDAAQALAAIRGLNEAIGNEAISASIRRMEEYTDKIFRYVAKYPEKRPQVDKFMKYYLPTAVNLLRRYQELEEHRVDSVRISGQMQSISDTISKLADTFGKQLESLLMDDEMDINAEMKVLEDMLEADGLTGDGFPKL
ncbi:MAG: 5-bromo-4-chloroindolyl phosphate hydrolysis family protein [Clostridiales bacterium]|nr:5-bromo-4-chloroindolyl phosphate hydrolysis family protein [Clostridiales bacterium]